MNNSLFLNDDGYTAQAEEINNETYAVCNPIFIRMVSKGYSAREIAHIMEWAIKDIELNIVLDKRAGDYIKPKVYDNCSGEAPLTLCQGI